MSKTIELTAEIMAIMQQAGVSEAEIEGMKVKPAKTTTRPVKGSRQIPATEYILKSVRRCKLCGYDSISYFSMERNIDNPSVLESHPLSAPTKSEVQIRYKIWATCKHCEEYLQTLDKNDLVAIVLKLHTGREMWK